MHADPQHVENSLASIQSLVDQALEATDTRQMSEQATKAQAATVELERYLQDGLDSHAYPQNERAAVGGAAAALSEAVVMAEKVALGTDVQSMRSRVVDFKTSIDEATLKVKEALRLE